MVVGTKFIAPQIIVSEPSPVSTLATNMAAKYKKIVVVITPHGGP